MKHIWIVVGYSESGDNYGPFVFDHEPTDQELSAICEFDPYEEDDEDAPGDFNSYIHLTVSKSQLNTLTEP